MKMKPLFVIAALLLFVNISCDSPQDVTVENIVTIHELDDPDGMNPLTSNAANSEYIQNNIFQKLLVYDPVSLELTPQLATSRPIIEAIEAGKYQGGMSLRYEIDSRAKWDNGTPITANDYIFTIKAIKNPKVNSAQLKPYLEFVKEIEIDSANPYAFTIYSTERYFRAEESSGNFPFVLPEYHYDPEGIMRTFSFEQLNDPNYTSELMRDENISSFANQFNGPMFNRDISNVVGSGPYKLSSWETGQRLVLEKKDNWWAKDITDNMMLSANLDKIVYRIIRDWNAAITNAKDGQLDVLRTIPPNQFTMLKNDKAFNETYQLSSPDQFAYHYIGFNTKTPFFEDKRVRKAISHLVDRDDIISTVFEGMAVKTNSPINPNKGYYNSDIKPINYNVDAAKALLTDAGWIDTDGDNIIDKMVGGKKVDFSVKYKYNQGHTVRKSIGIMLKNEAKRVGIDIQLTPVDFPSLLEDADNRNFDMLALAWINTPGLDEMKQVWHSEADSEGGSNRVGFSNETCDKLIDQIRVTLDEEKRNDMYRQIQQIIHDEQPYIFLFVPSECIAISSKFKGTETTPVRPGYVEAMFELR